MLQFKKIELEDIDIYKKIFSNSKELSCENSFANLLVWQAAYNNMIAVYDDILFIKSGQGVTESFRLPLGGDLERGIKLVEEYCQGKKPFFWAQEGPVFELFKEKFSDSYTFNENRDAFDYIYLRENLATLSGKKYHSKRNHISAFTKAYNWEYRPVTDENIDDIKACSELWYKENSHRLDRTMLHEKKGINTMLDNMKKLSVKGGAIYVDGKAVAFTLGSATNSLIFDIHIEKALSDYAAAYTVINREFAKNELSDYKYINREDDLGHEGLRKAKLSYKPEILLKKYSCR